jgi:hypothetical protein
MPMNHCAWRAVIEGSGMIGKGEEVCDVKFNERDYIQISFVGIFSIFFFVVILILINSFKKLKVFDFLKFTKC